MTSAKALSAMLLIAMLITGCVHKQNEPVASQSETANVRVAARPSRKNPPTGVPSGSKWKTGVMCTYRIEGELRNPRRSRRAPPGVTESEGAAAWACSGAWHVWQDILPDADSDSSWKISWPQ